MKDLVTNAKMPIRSVERTLVILQAMNRRPVSTIDYLHKATGLPKPTLVRFLSTLSQAGFVNRSEQLSGYQLTSLVRSLSSGYHGDPLIVEAGASIAREITREIKWPISIALPDGLGVRVRLSTASDSPISPFHSPVHTHLGFFLRSLGRAYLAYCAPEQVEIYAQQAVSEGVEGHRIAGDAEELNSLVSATRWKGYALRAREVEPHSDTLAVPIFLDGTVRATLGVTFFRSAVNCEVAISRLANRLKIASKEITRETELLLE
ncbi:MAG: helix-turn-helix domain-containing protein [Paracoccaceae bacterium]